MKHLKRSFYRFYMKKILLFVLFIASCDAGFDYETRHGIFVTLGEINRPSQEIVETWTDETLAFWHNTMTWQDCTNIDGTTAIFVDEIVLTTVDGQKAWAYCDLYCQIIVMGLGSEDEQKRSKIVRSEFMHELSHLIAYFCGNFSRQDESHKFFRDVGTPF